MAQEWAKPFYDSKAWQRCRQAYIAHRTSIDGGLCEVCHEKPGYIVHHKIWLNEMNINDPGVTLNFDNLRYECLDCHNLEEEDGGKKIRLTRVAFGPDGEVYEIPQPGREKRERESPH